MWLTPLCLEHSGSATVSISGVVSYTIYLYIFILTKLFLAIAVMDHYQGTAVELTVLTRKLFGVLFPGDHDWRPMIFMYLHY